MIDFFWLNYTVKKQTELSLSEPDSFYSAHIRKLKSMPQVIQSIEIMFTVPFIIFNLNPPCIRYSKFTRIFVSSIH